MENTTITRTEKNVETIRQGYAAFNKGDFDTLSELFDENATWHTPGESSMAGKYQGRDAIMAHFARLGSETDGTMHATLKDVFRSDNDRVVGLHTNSGVRNGTKLDTDSCIVFEFRNGVIFNAREYFFDLYAMDRFWK